MSHLPRRDRVERLARAVVREARRDRLPFMAGSIAYHAFVSLLPSLVLALAVLATVGGPTVVTTALDAVRAALSPGAGDVLVAELRRVGDATGLSALGAVVLLWGTLRIFRGLDTAFSDVYGSAATNTLPNQLRDAVVVLATLSFATLVASVVEGYVRSATASVAPWVGARLALAAGLAVALYPLYYVFPDVDVTPVEVVPGVCVAAVGLTAFESLFRLYLAFSARAPRSSVVAAVLVLLTWLYFSALVVLFGAVVNAVLANRGTSVDVSPVVERTAPTAVVAPTGAVDDDLGTSLDALGRTLEDADRVAVTGDGTTVELPAPDVVSAEVDEGRLRSATGSTALSLRWEGGG